MSDLMHRISELLYLCPVCSGFTFSQHSMAEYSKEWNKCPSCGYMEEKTVSINRVLNRLAPDKLSEPFIAPITAEIIQNVSSFTIGRTYSHSQDNANNDTKCPNCKGDIDDIL